MSKRRKIVTAVISIFLVLVICAGGYVGNMLGYFNKGNALSYSASRCQREDSTLEGKTIIFLGSSVTYGYGSKGDSFVDYLAVQDGVNAIKEAKSGTTLVDDSSSSYVSRMKNIDTSIEADALVCQLSTNDATKDKPLGELSEGYDMDSLDTHTIIGAIEYIIAYARDTWHCPVVFYTSARYDSEKYGEMVDALLQIQKKWDIGVIDLWSDTELNDISDDQRSIYMVDHIHPTRAGYRDWWTPTIRQQLKNYV